MSADDSTPLDDEESTPAATNDSEETTAMDELSRAFEDSVHSTTDPTRLTLDEEPTKELQREMDWKTVAHIHHCPTYDCSAYYSVRDEDGHYMYKYNGYAIDEAILNELEEDGVEKIFIGTKKGRTVYEFDLEQYTSQNLWNEGFGDQRCAPLSEALKEWPNAVGNVFDE